MKDGKVSSQLNLTAKTAYTVPGLRRERLTPNHPKQSTALQEVQDPCNGQEIFKLVMTSRK